jgi:peptidoglycan hydrolase CwlO-like protein
MINGNNKWLWPIIITVGITITGGAIGYGVNIEKIDSTKQELAAHCINQEKELSGIKADTKELAKAVSDLTTEIRVLNAEMKMRRR